MSCSFHLPTQLQVAVAANHSNSFSHKHALPVTGNPFSIALPFSGTPSHKTFKHTPTAPHSGKPLNSTGQHIDTQPHKAFPYHSLRPSQGERGQIATRTTFLLTAPLFFTFLTSNFPTLFAFLKFILSSGSFLKIPSGKRKISKKPPKTP